MIFVQHEIQPLRVYCGEGVEAHGKVPYNLIDMETGEKMRIQPTEFKEHYTKSIQNYFDELKIRMINNKIDYITVDIDKGYDQVLINYLLKRQKLH